MAVAIGNTGKPVPYIGVATLSYSFSYNNNGSTLLLFTVGYEYSAPTNITATYAGQSMTTDWVFENSWYNPYLTGGLHLLNAPTGANTVVITFDDLVNEVYANLVSITGASTTTIAASNKTEILNGTDVELISTLNVSSVTGNLVVAAGLAQRGSDGAGIDYTTGTWITAPTNLTGNCASYSGATTVPVKFGVLAVGFENAQFSYGAWSIPPPGGLAFNNTNKVIGPQVTMWTRWKI